MQKRSVVEDIRSFTYDGLKYSITSKVHAFKLFNIVIVIIAPDIHVEVTLVVGVVG